MKIAIDFDGTCVVNQYPKIGAAAPDCQRVLKDMVKDGHKLILLTMRTGPELRDAIRWFDQHSIELWGIMKDPEQHKWTDSPKCYADIYIDDHALGCPMVYLPNWDKEVVDWQRVEHLIYDYGDMDHG